jgi:hypothetical protein
LGVEESISLSLAELKIRVEKSREVMLHQQFLHEEAVKIADEALIKLKKDYGVDSVEEAAKLLKDKAKAVENLIERANGVLDSA